ncbi:MAG: division/cell wall cluster transcriptional repressor MraZ [Myxococcota bacterium]
MFRGRHDHTIDKKGRLSIPAGFRVELQERSQKAPMLTISRNHLELYPREDYDAIERDLAAKSDLQPNVQAYRRVFIGLATECPIDGQGRILVPPSLREHAQLENAVTVVGNLQKIEVWQTEAFDRELTTTLARLEEIQRSVDKGSDD